jgi:hypothetical protein
VTETPKVHAIPLNVGQQLIMRRADAQSAS